MIIRPMTIDDYDEVFAMWQITTKRALSKADERSQIERYLRRNEGMSQVAVIDGKIVGTVLAGHDGRRGFIHHMAVMPEYRRRNRAIDHGRLLAEAVARRLSLPCRQLLLRRDRREKRQVGLNEKERAANLAGAFTPKEKITFPVLIVDDVRTTGTTLCRCAEALRSGGAEKIFGLTVTARK